MKKQKTKTNIGSALILIFSILFVCNFISTGIKVDADESGKVYVDESGDFHGYAWGEKNVGWISFNNKNHNGEIEYKTFIDFQEKVEEEIKEVKVVISASPSEVYAGGNSEVKWKSENANECEIACEYPDNSVKECVFPPISESEGSNLKGKKIIKGINNDTVYYIKCFNEQNSGGAQAKIVVKEKSEEKDEEVKGETGLSILADPEEIQLGGKSTIKWKSENANKCFGACSSKECEFFVDSPSNNEYTEYETVALSEDTTYQVNCDDKFASVKVTVFQPESYIKPESNIVEKGEKTIIDWEAKNVGNCKIYGPKGKILDSKDSFEGSFETEEINGQVSYTLICETNFGVKLEKSITIKMNPVWEEF